MISPFSIIIIIAGESAKKSFIKFISLKCFSRRKSLLKGKRFLGQLKYSLKYQSRYSQSSPIDLVEELTLVREVLLYVGKCMSLALLIYKGL